MRTCFFILLMIAFFNSYSDGNKLYYAEMLEKSCEYSRAIDEYKKALKTNISKDIESDAYRGLAINSLLINDTANAIFYFDKLCRIDIDTSYFYSEEFRMNAGYISRLNQNIEYVYFSVCKHIVYYNVDLISLIGRYNDILEEYNVRCIKDKDRDLFEYYEDAIKYYNKFYVYFREMYDKSIYYNTDRVFKFKILDSINGFIQVYPISCGGNGKEERFEINEFRMYYNSLIKVFTKEEIENILDNPAIEYEEVGDRIYYYWNFGKGIRVRRLIELKKNIDIEKSIETVIKIIKSKKIIEYIKTHLNNNTPFIEEVITKVEK